MAVYCGRRTLNQAIININIIKPLVSAICLSEYLIRPLFVVVLPAISPLTILGHRFDIEPRIVTP